MKAFTSIFLALLCFSTVPSCSNGQTGSLVRVPFDADANAPLNLSEIVKETRTITLETTDSSLINPQRFRRALVSDDYIVIAQLDNVFLFDGQGKFLHSIGRVGQGPGEYQRGIANVSVDFHRRLIYLLCSNNLICYNIDGKYLKSIPIKGLSRDIYADKDNLWTLMENINEQTRKRELTFFKLNTDLHVTDSIHYRSVTTRALVSSPLAEGFTHLGDKLYTYYFEGEEEPIFRDTLSRIENNRIIPTMKLEMRNAEDIRGNHTVSLINIYRSDRYAFATCLKDGRWFYCYDTKEGKAYFQKGGFTDDLSGSEEPAAIRPLQTDANCIYYLTPDPNDEEANHLLTIATLKN
jgi:hypothetical protein